MRVVLNKEKAKEVEAKVQEEKDAAKSDKEHERE